MNALEKFMKEFNFGTMRASVELKIASSSIKDFKEGKKKLTSGAIDKIHAARARLKRQQKLVKPRF